MRPRTEAVALLTDRARQAGVPLTLDGRTGPEVTRLVRRLDGMPLAIELAAARVEALGVAGLLDRLDDRFALLASGDRLARPGSSRWPPPCSGAISCWRPGRAAGIPGGVGVPWLVHAEGRRSGGRDRCRARGAAACGLLAAVPAADRPGWAVPVRDAGDAARLRGTAPGRRRRAGRGGRRAGRVRAAGGCAPRGGAADGRRGAGHGPVAGCRGPRLASGAGLGRGPRRCRTALRLVDALGWWWQLRGRLPGQYRLLREVAASAEAGSEGWCTAQCWLGWAALLSAGPAAALGHFTAVLDAVGDRGPSRVLADALVGRSTSLQLTGRVAEGAEEARRSLAVARELGYLAGEGMALGRLAMAANYGGDFDGAVELSGSKSSS